MISLYKYINDELDHIELEISKLLSSQDAVEEERKLEMAIKQFSKLGNFEVIDREVINRFIDKIVVLDRNKVDIHYAFNTEYIKGNYN